MKKVKFRKGGVCPKCGKGKLEAACKVSSGHKNHLVCKTCHFTNF